MAITVLLESEGGPKALKRELRPATTEAMNDVGEDWAEEKLPGHFTTRAATKYGYQKRSRKFMIRKASGYTDQYGVRHAGHQRALVWSGESERMMTAGARIKATSKGVDVKMLAPKHLYARRKDLRQPDKAAETTRLSDDEVTGYQAMLADGVADHLNRIRTRETERIAG